MKKLILTLMIALVGTVAVRAAQLDCVFSKIKEIPGLMERMNIDGNSINFN